MISLLFNSDKHETGTVFGVESLKLAEFLSNCFCDDTVGQYTMDILSKPLLDRADISYRQSVMQIFFNKMDAFHAILELYRRLEQLLVEWQNVKKDYAMLLRSGGEGASGYAQWSYLKESVRYVLKIKAGLVRQLEIISCLSSEPNPAMAGLCNFSTKAIALIEKNEPLFKTIIQSSYEHIDISVCVQLNDMAEVLQITLQPTKKIKKSRIFALHDTDKLFHEAIRHTNYILATINDAFFVQFVQLYKELQFYRFAVRYLQLMQDEQIQWIFPVISEKEGDLYVDHLYDPFLIAKQYSQNIIPRDIKLPANQSSILIGDNNTGKTFFLRAIAYVQLFAQAGLPIPANNALVSIRKNIYIVFASRELQEKKDFLNVGLFERDVIQMAGVVNQVSSYDLVLINEVFQSTFYGEAAESLHNILQFFKRNMVQFVVVTHIERLLGYYQNDEVMIMKANPDYTILSI